tara:strand:+ start:9600 stop:10598 length:999 start_codon:yes stop_codon:yes gene_type:complete
MDQEPIQKKIIGVGNPVMDFLAHVSEDFVTSVAGEKGGMVLVDTPAMDTLMSQLPAEPTQAPGGSAGNTILGLAELGHTPAMLGKIGNCETGQSYKEVLVERGGDGSRFKIGSIANGRCLSLITPDSERTMRTDLGAAMTLHPDEIALKDFHGYQHAHIEGYILFNRELMFKVLDTAKEAGCTVSLDLASFEVVHAAKDIMEDIIVQYVDYVFSNEEEAEAFTNMGKDYHGMVLHLATLAEIAVVKLGKEGSMIGYGTEVISVDAHTVERLVDTTGAGDLWASGFLHGLLNGHDLHQAGKFASMVGAEAVQVLGAALPEDRWQILHQQLGAG